MSAGGKYHIKWHKYPSTENTWEAAKNLPGELIEAFHAKGMPADDASDVGQVASLCM